MNVLRLRAFAFSLLALLFEASCSSSSGMLPGSPTPPVSSVTYARFAPRQAGGATIVSCRVVTPAKRTALNPPPSQTFTIPKGVNPSSSVFYFEIGIGNWCYGLPQPLYAALPGKVSGSKIAFATGRGRVTLSAGQPYVYIAYAVPAAPAKYIYAIDHANSNVSVFKADANGNVAPAYQITNVGGVKSMPQGIAEDANGYLYVTTIAANGKTTSVEVFAPGAKGSAKPVRTIIGKHTTLNNNYSDTGVGPDGSVYVNTGTGVAVFAPKANGDVKPVRVITGLNGGGAAVSAANLLYTSTSIGKTASAIDGFGPLADGAASPVITLTGKRANVTTHLVGLDAQGNVYQCLGKAVLEFGSYQQGDAIPIRHIAGSDLKFTGLQPIGVDAAGNVFVGDEDGGKIYRFAPDADGDVAPLATISGSNTGLVNPAAIAVGK